MILAHLSDFHLRPDFSEICKNKIKQINECLLDNEVDIVVYTGDIVDFNYIKSSENFERINESYKFAVEAFKLLTNNRNLSNFIFCPGNHDLIRQEFDVIESDCEIIDENSEKNIVAFSHYNAFLKELGLTAENHSTRLKKIYVGNDCYNFLIANTNWFRENTQSKSTKSCINCMEVSKLIDSLDINDDKANNIFVSHLPLDYICECAKYNYEGFTANLSEKISNRFLMCLAGDKHTLSSANGTYIVGNPLYVNESIIAIHRFQDGIHNCCNIKIREGEIIKLSDLNKTKQVLDLCQNYITDNAKKLFISNDSNNLKFEDLNKLFSLSGRVVLDKVEKLYSKIINFKQFDENTGEFNKKIKSFSFSSIAQLIEKYDGTNKNVINFRGEHEAGKSTFLSILFLFMLHQHEYNSFKYVPVYFNIEYHRVNGDSQKEITKSFEDFVNNVEKLCLGFDKSPCYIIDGLNQYCMFGDDPDLGRCFDDIIKEKILNFDNSKIILSIDTFSQPMDFTKSVFDYSRGVWKNSRYLFYFNTIRSIPQKKEELLDVLYLISSIKKDCAVNFEKICNQIFGESIIEMNLMFLYENYRKFESSNKNVLYQINANFQNKLFARHNKLEKAQKIVIEVFHNNKIFSDIHIGKNDKENITMFQYIKSHRTFSNYLFALYYVDEIKRLVSKSNKKNEAKTIVNAVFPREIFHSIRQEFEVRKGTNDICVCLDLVTKGKISNFDFIGIANLVYLLGGRVGIYEKSKIENVERTFLKKRTRSDVERFKKLILKRTITISSILLSSGADLEFAINKYLNELISSNEYRNVNRIFHRMYYQDSYNLMEIERVYWDYGNSTNWDFYFTYHTLISKINVALENKAKSNLLEIDLFTLCDLISSRLRNKYNDSQYTFFYNPCKINTIMYILKGALDLIDKYLSEYRNCCNNVKFEAYLENCKRDFQCFSIFLEYNTDEIYMHPSLIINQLDLIKKQERQGWMIKNLYNMRTLSETDFMTQKEYDSVETVAEHIYMTYLIGLFFLPNRVSKYPHYNKQTILNMILIHDIGEAAVGDTSPYMNNYDEVKMKEDQFNRSIFSSWMYMDNVDYSEQINLWDLLHNNKDNINCKIAHELDIIQLLFELNKIKDKEKRFTEERLNEFYKIGNKIQTSVGKHIYKLIVEENVNINLCEFLNQLNSEDK